MSRSPAAMSPSDRALVLAAIAFDDPKGDRVWHRFAPSWRDQLRDAWADALARGMDRQAARDALAREHAAEARPDPERVHASWWVRALQEESPAVRAAVLAHASEPVRSILRDGLKLDDAEPTAASKAHPEAVRRALSLWAERLVGGLPAGEDGPPVVAALTGLPNRDLARLIATVAPGQVGLRARGRRRAAEGGPVAFAQAPAARTARTPPRRLEPARFPSRAARPAGPGAPRRRPGRGRPPEARPDHVCPAAGPGRSASHALGALQHLPYPLAKFIRSRSGLKTPFIHGRELVAWEETLFQAAQDLLREERRRGAASEPELPTDPEGDSV